VAQTGFDKVVFGGDFNFQCDVPTSCFSLFQECFKNLDLVCCDNFVQSSTGSSFTYSHSVMEKVSRNILSAATAVEIISSSKPGQLSIGGPMVSRILNKLPLMLTTCGLLGVVQNRVKYFD